MPSNPLFSGEDPNANSGNDSQKVVINPLFQGAPETPIKPQATPSQPSGQNELMAGRTQNVIEEHPKEYYEKVPFISGKDSVAARALRAAPADVSEMYKGFVGALSDIPATAMKAGELGESLLYKGAGKAGYQLAETPEDQAKKEQAAGKWIEDISERFGSIPGIKKTLSEHPIQTATDIASGLTVGGKGLGLSGKVLEKMNVPGAETVTGLGKAVGAAGEWGSPLTIPYKIGESAVKSTAPIAQYAMHGTSGLSTEALKEFSGPHGNTAFAAATGKIRPADTVQFVVDEIGNRKKSRHDNYVNNMNAFQRQNLFKPGLSFNEIDNTIADAKRKAASGPLGLRKHQAAIDAINDAEAIVNQYKAAAAKHPYYSTVKGFDDLKQAIDDIGFNHLDPKAQKHLGSIRNSAKKTISNVDKTYANIMDEYSTESSAIARLQSELLSGGTSKTNVGATLRKLINAQKNKYKNDLLKDLSENNPQISAAIAGHELAQSHAPIKNVLGGLLGASLVHGGIGAALPFTSPTISAATSYGLGKIGRTVEPISRQLPTLAASTYLAGRAPEQNEQARGGVARATGGRVMTAERMISMAKRAKKEIENQTKSLLEEPDEHIVKALKVANEHI
jgi:hypothetical protein